jgi:hypothetical protein
MSITFDHVEGVVQKAGESAAPAPSGEATPAAEKPSAESLEETRRRMERMARRLHAD